MGYKLYGTNSEKSLSDIRSWKFLIVMVFICFFFVLSIASDDSYRVWGGAVGLVTLLGSNLWRHFTPRTWDTWDTVPEKVRLKKFQLTLAAIFYAMERDFKL